MKKYNVILAFSIFVFSIFIISCEDNLDTRQEIGILPQNFKVDIPDAISQQSLQLKSAAVDTIQGNDI